MKHQILRYIKVLLQILLILIYYFITSLLFISLAILTFLIQLIRILFFIDLRIIIIFLQNLYSKLYRYYLRKRWLSPINYRSIEFALFTKSHHLFQIPRAQLRIYQGLYILKIIIYLGLIFFIVILPIYIFVKIWQIFIIGNNFFFQHFIKLSLFFFLIFFNIFDHYFLWSSPEIIILF